jgi:hypothetical protein
MEDFAIVIAFRFITRDAVCGRETAPRTRRTAQTFCVYCVIVAGQRGMQENRQACAGA